MSDRQSCVYLLLRQSVTFPKQYPEYIQSYREEEDAHAAATRWNTYENTEHHFYVRNIWL